MKRPSLLARPFVHLLLVIVAACGGDLISDPSFELWCKNTLCAPWEVTGKVQRVGTWHRRDYGVSLGDGAAVAQLSEHERVECIEFSVIADLEASADVFLEMDFQDDGTAEYRQLLPESRWAKLRYLVKPPTWYERVRFTVRKEGKGRAVLAQIRAVTSDECEGKPLPLSERPLGALCESDAQCAGSLCSEAPAERAWPFSEAPPHVCNGCTPETGCAQGELCALTEGEHGLHYACVQAGSRQLGVACGNGNECESGICAETILEGLSRCGECVDEADCGQQQTCAPRMTERGPARLCTAWRSLPLGESCSTHLECASELCCEGTCAQACR